MADRRAGNVSIEGMLDAMRRTICLGDPTTSMLLHENKLAAKFGVSRTPVRQVLQRLAYEGLVETRTGIGTAVVPLDPARMERDFALLAGILDLAVALGPGPLRQAPPVLPPAETRGGVSLLEVVLAERAAILALAGSLIDDPILSDSHTAAHWRVVRWRLAAARADPAGAIGALIALVTRLRDEWSAAAILRAVAAEQVPGNLSGQV